MLSRSKGAFVPQYKSRVNPLTVVAHSAVMSHTKQQAVHTPLCDKRKYQHALLSNGLRALVVQDKDAIYAAACASVQVGYFDDPSHLPGAAHFLEHMVHLGSVRYPDEREYKSFLAQHGGSSNASTSMAHTKYHFKVHHTALQGALHRFGAMLSCPLISQGSAAREVENVHAEYSRNMNSDGRKLLQLRRSLCAAPYSNFSTGSLTTLWEQPQQQQLVVPAALRSLWESFYKADGTCVAVVGPQEPQVLLQWVEEAFTEMPSSNSKLSSTRSTANGSSISCSTGQRASGIPEAAVTVGEVPAVHRYPVDVVGCDSREVLVRVCPQRDLRELELSWYIPQGMMTYSSTKPWSWASHVLGHEGHGSVAHLLKAQGMVQSLDVGTGEEVRLGRGWMFWRVHVSLTQAGEDALPHVVATIHRGIQLLRRCSDAELSSTWHEAARLAELRFNWQDPTEPLTCAQAAAYALHYYTPQATLSGSHLMTEFDPSVLRWFAQQLTSSNMVIYYSSQKNRSLVDSKEQWYGAEYSVQHLPGDWLDRIERYTAVDLASDAAAAGSAVSSTQTARHRDSKEIGASNNIPASERVEGSELRQQHKQAVVLEPLPGQLHLPEPNWALPEDLSLRHEDTDASDAGLSSPAAAVYNGAPPPPELLLESPGLCVWHKRDVSYGLPKVHLHLHLVTPLTYSTPEATISTRLLLRVLEDLLMPVTYPAELAGSWYDISCEQGGLALRVVGFPGVAQKLLMLVLQGLVGLTAPQVQERFATMSGRLMQNLTNWAKNNPQQHAEYAAHHLLQQHHHHNAQLLQAAAAAGPECVSALQQQLATGVDLHVDMLAYGNISSQEVLALMSQLQQQLKPQGLPAGLWPPAGRVLKLGPDSSPATDGVEEANSRSAAASSVAAEGEGWCNQQASPACSNGCNVFITYLPDNPNPCNSNSAIYYMVQLGPDFVSTSILLDLFVQMSSKAAFHELRTRQRLGYSVNLSSCSLHRQLGLTIRVQSPSMSPDVCVTAVRGWLTGFRAQLQEMAQHQLDNAKKALRDKYLDPPKSLHEAARRTWLPIKSRSLSFDKRKQKAAEVQQLAQQQLLEFYDTYVHPEGPSHQALCVHIWGGRQRPPAASTNQSQSVVAPCSDDSIISGGNVAKPVMRSSCSITVPADGAVSFKQIQPLLPLADISFPPPAGSA